MAGYNKVIFLNRVQLVWIQSFSSPRLVALQNLKDPVCPIINPLLGEEQIYSCLSKGN